MVAALHIKALSAVLRLGRTGASTDHSSVLFNVDIPTGIIGNGTVNSHWYQLGLQHTFRSPWLSPPTFTSHPDQPYPSVTGSTVPDMAAAVDIVIKYVNQFYPYIREY